MAWVEYNRKPQTEWEEYWKIRCRWMEEQLEICVALLTDDQRKHFDIRKLEWKEEKAYE